MEYCIMVDHTVVEVVSKPPTQEDIQCVANECCGSAYVISGQHFGISADPQADDDDMNESALDGLFRMFAEDLEIDIEA